MDLFNEIDDITDLFFSEKISKIDSVIGEHEDLQSKYSNLHENYAREIENSKKVEKCLVKCLKFYSKLCKKYEIQQKLIKNLEENIKEKINRLEEAQKSEERLNGLIQVYRMERTLYAGQTTSQLRKDKELLLDICCTLLSESAKTSTSKNLSQLILRKFKKDLSNEKLDLLRGKFIKLKDEPDFNGLKAAKPEYIDLKNEIKPKPENKVGTVEDTKVKDVEDTKDHLLDLSFINKITEESYTLDNEQSNKVSDKEVFVEVEQITAGDISSLPSLEEHPATLLLNEKCRSYISVDENPDGEENHFDSSGNRCESDVFEPGSERINEFSSPTHSASVEKDSAALVVNEAPRSPTRSVGKSGSIFDISTICPTVSNCGADIKQCLSEAVESESFSGITFDIEDKSDDLKTADMNLEINYSEEEAVSPHEIQLLKIFREMTSVRLLSPIREYSNFSISNKNVTVTLNVGENKEGEKVNSSPKRSLDANENANKSKKPKLEEKKTDCNLLDSIMTAMSIQNDQFKAKRISSKEIEINGESLCESQSPSEKSFVNKGSSKENFLSIHQSPKKKIANQRTIEKFVMKEIKNFVLSSISSKEEADKNVRHCLSVLSNKSEDVIAKCIVAIIFENVDESVELFERPSPPLTKTQHRLIVLLSVFRTFDQKFQNLSDNILSIISEKLLPDNFFWPDDSVEAATRFYAALCRARNDPKTLWRFCLQGMTDMRQRSPLLMLTALKTWPDVLNDSSTLKSNILAVTIVNIFLHMPKKEGHRNYNQGRKLIALKHLLQNFYQFKVDDTIEGYAKKVLDSFFREEPGSEKSLVLLSKCRDQSWTVKNVLSILESKLVDWAEERVEDAVAYRILSVIKQISPALQQDSARAKLKNVGLCLSQILTSAKKNHDSEVRVIQVLLQLKQFPEVQKVIREWIPKNPIDDDLRDELINASAENILRELRLNRRKELKTLNAKKKIKKQSKKSKKKKLKGKKLKKNEGKLKATSVSD